MPAGILANTAMSRGRATRRGHTLLELLVVVSVLAVIAAVAAPAFNNDDEAALDRAASEVASAIRFAHSEAIRTGVSHGVYATQIGQRIRVYRLPAATPIYDIYDPLTKRLYDFDYSTDPTGVNVSSVYFKFSGVPGSTSYLGFAGGSGAPKFSIFGSIRMLDTGYVRLRYRDAERTVGISPMTGRVIVQ